VIPDDAPASPGAPLALGSECAGRVVAVGDGVDGLAVGQPVIAVPSSTGYGVAAGGTSALHSMLSSCGQGVLVTNIDNGFGAACGAIRMLAMAGGQHT